MAKWYARLLVVLHSRVQAVQRRGDRGDVPGWVMVTVMTAGLVAVIFAVFKQAIVEAITNAIDQVVTSTDGSSG